MSRRLQYNVVAAPRSELSLPGFPGVRAMLLPGMRREENE